MAESGWKGQISEFKLNEDNFNSWIERFELYILLNEINVHNKKLMFSTLLGNEGYSLVRDLCTPSKPVDKSYVVLKELLEQYVNPKPNTVTERFKFKERKQVDESVMKFITSLKNMSELWEFGKHLNDDLRNQVIWASRMRI